MDFRGAPGNALVVRVNETLACEKPMESAYYYQNLSDRGDYKLVCYHCGSEDGCRLDRNLQLEYSIVMPQCSACRGKGVEAFCRRPIANKDANVISERHRIGVEADIEEGRQAERVANPIPDRTDVGCDKVNQVVGARTSNDGSVDYFIHWAKMDGEEYPISACTWEQRDQPGIKESNLDESFLVQMPVETATAKRSNEGYTTGYDRAKKRFKVDLDGKGILKNFHKPDKNHSWVLL